MPPIRASSFGWLTLIVGTFGLVPGVSDALVALWPTMVASLAPMVLHLGGESLAEQAGWEDRGRLVQRLGGLWFLALWTAVVAQLAVAPSEGAVMGLLLGGVGVPMAVSLLFAGADTSTIDPEAARALRPGAVITTLGYDAIGMTLVSLAFVVVGGLLVVRDPQESKAWISALFFVGCTGVGIHELVTRWTAVVSQPRWLVGLGRLGLVGGAACMVAATVGFALLWGD